jgi:hypothetical protein
MLPESNLLTSGTEKKNENEADWAIAQILRRSVESFQDEIEAE